jgi:hypothetical protein
MRWKTPEDRFVYLSLAKAAVLLVVVTMIVFVITHYAAWGTFPE